MSAPKFRIESPVMNQPNTTNPVRWGMLGTARIADKVTTAIHNANGAEFTAVASRSAEKASAWANEHGATKSYGSYAELLDDDDIDAVYIPLPPSLHKEWTIAAAKKGKHVLCEKPTALNSGEVEEMIAACRENNVQLMDGVMWVHHPRANDMRRIITDGSLGKLRRLTSAFSFHWDEIPHGDLRLSRELGGGSLLDLGWYCVRAALWAFGELPTRVSGFADWYNDVDMSFSGLMWFSENRVASFDCAFDTLARRWVEVTGTHGSVVCDEFVIPWNADKPRFWVHGDEGASVEHVSSTVIQEVCMIEDFVQCVRNGTPDLRWPNETLATQRVCDALAKSARNGGVVEVNSEGVDNSLLAT